MREFLPGDLITVDMKPDQGWVYLRKEKFKSGYQPDQITARVENGGVGMVLYANSNEGEIFVMFPGPSIGWTWRSNLTRVKRNAC